MIDKAKKPERSEIFIFQNVGHKEFIKLILCDMYNQQGTQSIPVLW